VHRNFEVVRQKSKTHCSALKEEKISYDERMNNVRFFCVGLSSDSSSYYYYEYRAQSTHRANKNTQKTLKKTF